MTSANTAAIESVIATLEKTEEPIVEGVNELVAAGAPNATVMAAKSDHLIWMRKLAQMLAGRISLDADELADHNTCRLGKWYNAQADKELTGHPAWAALLAPHQEVHRAGIAAARAYAAGDLDEAVAHVEEAGAASLEVLRLLDDLIRR